MKTKIQFLAYFATMLWDVSVAWPAILLIRALWGRNLRWETPPAPHPGGPVLVCELRPDSWPARTWYRPWGATTLGHAIFYNVGQVEPKDWNSIQQHEHVHVEQFEGIALASFFFGLTTAITLATLGHGVAAFVLGTTEWWVGYLLWGACNWAVAGLRGESVYRGSSHEEGAFAQGDEYHREHEN